MNEAAAVFVCGQSLAVGPGPIAVPAPFVNENQPDAVKIIGQPLRANVIRSGRVRHEPRAYDPSRASS